MNIYSEEYEKISDYGIIGNLRTAALVSVNGSIDWLCLPDFDSPSLFSGLVDKDRGGCFSIKPAGKYFSKQKYLEKTNILETTFYTQNGKIIRLTDFMPLEDTGNKKSVLIRKLEGIEGTLPVSFVFNPKFDYARSEPTLEIAQDGIIKAYNDTNTLILQTDIDVHIVDNKVIGDFVLKDGNIHWFILHYEDKYFESVHANQVLSFDETVEELEKTKYFWEDWSANLNYSGAFDQEVLRSLLILKLLIHNQTGGLINSPVTSLDAQKPKDGRYCWLREVFFAFNALINTGYKDEAFKLTEWLEHVCKNLGKNLQPVVGLRGERDLIEHNLNYLSGYKNLSPVKIGDNSYTQFDLSTYGLVLMCFENSVKHGYSLDEQILNLIIDYTRILSQSWHNPDNGIWSMEAKQYTFSKIAAWLGLDAGIKLVKQFRDNYHEIDKWISSKDNLYFQLEELGWNNDIKSYTLYYASNMPDSSLLLLNILNFSGSNDDKTRSTINKIREDLALDHMLYKYKNEKGDKQSVYTLCAFWLAHSYALLGKKDYAHSIIEHNLIFAGHHKIFAEGIHIDSHNKLGNYPFSPAHTAFINAVLSLSH